MFQTIDAVCSSATTHRAAAMKRADQVGPLFAEVRPWDLVGDSARSASGLRTSAAGHLIDKVQILVDSLAGHGRQFRSFAGR